MKFLFATMLFLGILFSSCTKEPHSGHGDKDNFEYHAHINAPDATAKSLGDMLEIAVTFESHTGKPVHHVQVTIKDNTVNTIIYTKPTEAHVHETDGKYEFKDTIELSTANQFKQNGDYTLTAKVWGHDAGQNEEVERVSFKVN